VLVTIALWPFLPATKPFLIHSTIQAFGLMIGLFAGLVFTRRTLGKLQIALFRQGIGVRRSLILGRNAEANSLFERISQNPWLGEHPIRFPDRSPSEPESSFSQTLASIVREQSVDVIWLTLPTDPADQDWLPAYFFTAEGNKPIWRMLPEHLNRISKANTSQLSFTQIEAFYHRVQHSISLPVLSVVMIGSRGVPARYSGIETYIEEVGSELVKRGGKVAVYCHRRYVAARGVYKGMELRFVPTIHSKHLETIVHTLLATLHALLSQEEIFHYHALGPSTLSWIPRLWGKKVVVSVQGLDWERAKWGWLARQYLKFGEWASARFPHLTIMVSKALWQHYVDHYGADTLYIPNGFSKPVHLKPSIIRAQFGLGSRDYILFVGRLVPEKGCHTLIQAYRKINTEKYLVFAGTASFDQKYSQRLRQLAAGSDRIKFVGFVQNETLQELYSNAYLIVHPSEIEGLSIAVLEALSYGNCLLVSDRPENIEAIQGNGEVFKTGEVDDLARQLEHLLDHPEYVSEFRERLNASTRQASDWETVAKLTLNAYLRLAGETGCPLQDA
jgi:glycosyltransferase involved in cell wall biosynthesis